MIELKDAIEISRIISKTPEERIPLILSTLEKADLQIEGFEELEEWKMIHELNAIIDLNDFMTAFVEKFGDKLSEGYYTVPTQDFSSFCEEQKLRPAPVRRWLAKKGIIEHVDEKGGKISYTKTKKVEGKATRCVIIREDWNNTENKEETDNGCKDKNT